VTIPAGARAYGDETALVVVDVQNDFADPSGGLYVQGGEAVVALVNAEGRRHLAGALRRRHVGRRAAP
jgi:nicotinamidase-related amidase